MSSLTSAKTGTLYFAYGSNLSAHQMHYRCLDSPATSAVPVAIARLDGWKWVICERGYANIVPLAQELEAHNADTDADARTVWGVLYNMTPGDEKVLDQYEGHDEWRNPKPQANPDPETVRRTPYLQGEWVSRSSSRRALVLRYLFSPKNIVVL